MKKGQAAMEFLMTYGWAILVVLVAIGALAYFGVLSPSRFLPSSCTLIPGLACTDFKVDGTANTVTLVIQNGMGEDLNPFSITLADGVCVGDLATATDGLSDGEEETLTITCLTGDISGDRYKGDLTIAYTSGGVGGLTHTNTGSITSQIE